MAVGDPAYAPESPEEVAWYVRNGYPTFAMMTAADTVIPDLTQLDASDGFSPYEVVIASNLALTDEAERNEALSFLRNAAIEGSIYALESLDAINQHPFFNNKVQAAAYHKSSIMLGNWTGAFSLARAETLSSEEDMLSTLLALQFIEHANLVRSSHGLLPLERDLRPGLDQFLEALMLDMQAKANKAKTAY